MECDEGSIASYRRIIDSCVCELLTQWWDTILSHIVVMILALFYPCFVGSGQRVESNQYIPKSRRYPHSWKRMGIGIHSIHSYSDNVINIKDRIIRRLRIFQQIPECIGRSIQNGCITCMQLIAMEASENPRGARMATFDTDSSSIGVDNRCSGCISHRIEDFEGPLADTRKSIKGFGGSRTHDVKMGTIRWRWLDDSGSIHEFRIPRSYYIPSGKVRLLSPQHWAQSISGKNRRNGNAAGETTTGDKTVLFWENGRYKLTIPMCSKTNVATFQTAPGYKGYQLFLSGSNDRRGSGLSYHRTNRYG